MLTKSFQQLATTKSVVFSAEERGRMSARGSPQEGEGDSEQMQSALLERILENQDTIQSLSDKLMPLLVGNLQRLAEANRSDDSLLRDSETDDQAPRDPRIGGHRRPTPLEHVASGGRGELDTRMRGSQSLCDNEVGSAALYNPSNAAQNYLGNAAHDYKGNAAYNYQPKAIGAGQPSSIRAMQPVNTL